MSVLIALLTLAAGCLPPTAVSRKYDFAKIRRVGVLKFDAPSEASLGVEGLFAKHMLEQGYHVVERSRLEAILSEQKLGLAGVFSPRTVRSVGQLLGVDALLLGTITSYRPGSRQVIVVKDQFTHQEPILNVRAVRQGDGATGFVTEQIGMRVEHEVRDVPQVVTVDAEVGLIAKLVDVETGEIVWVGSATREDLSELCAAESAVSYLVRKLRKDWSPQVAVSLP